MEFTPVELVSPKGRPWTARTAAELVNLTGKGYRRADAPTPSPEDDAAPAAEPEQDNDQPGAAWPPAD